MFHEMDNYEPIETVSAVRAVTSRLRSQILDGQLAAGEQVTEMEVAQYYRVSRPTAKSAIQDLVSERLLHRKANKSAHVPRFTSDDIQDLFLARIPLEVGIVRLIVGRRQVPEGMTQAVRDISRLGGATPSKFVEADLRFHRLMVESLESHRLSHLFDLLQGEIHLSMVQSQRVLGADRVAEEHGEILQAIEKHDEVLSVEYMERHLKRACRDIAEHLDKQTAGYSRVDDSK